MCSLRPLRAGTVFGGGVGGTAACLEPRKMPNMALGAADAASHDPSWLPASKSRVSSASMRACCA
eukprot:360570-Pleurochrysis_carterae.AAC.6